MAEEAPSPPPAEPEPEPARLKRKVETLERELRSCQRRVREVERLYRSAESSNRELRVQVEELSKILHCGIKNDIKKSDVEVQTDDWPFSDCYYQTYCSSGGLPDKGAEFSAETLDSREQSPPEDAAHADAAVMGAAGCGPGGHQLASGSQEAALAAAAGEAPLEGSSLAESLRAAAEAAVSQTGFSYDENTGLYFDHTTGFYYDSENQLYYDPSTGIYYYCDVDSGRYQFHSRVDLQPYQNPPTRQSKDKKWKKRRKGPDGSAASEEKDLTSADQKAAGVDHASSGEGENFTNVRKKPKTGVGHQHSPPPLSAPVGEGSAGSPGDHMVSSAAHDDGRVTETDSEPEEGEITDSHSEASCEEEEDCPSGASATAAESEEEEERIWPPCIRVIVIRSPVLQTGSLFIITAVSPATIGREKDMEHTLRIPEVGVSKFHAEIHFDHDLQSYVLVDQGSQNGTTVNGKQILQPKTKCDPYVLEHGDEVRIGETVLSLHIHPGSETCDGCEPGQVRAHLRLDKKLGSCVGPALSKEEKELERRKELKKIRVKYGLQNTDYEDEKALKNPKYKDRAGKRREQVGSEGTFLRDDAPASVHCEITDSNKGRKMLEKMGWKKGEGLGKDSSGLLTPLQLQLRQARAGLGSGRPSSVDDVQLLQSKTKKNWDKARERFAENFPETQPPKDPAAPMPWVKGAAE